MSFIHEPCIPASASKDAADELRALIHEDERLLTRKLHPLLEWDQMVKEFDACLEAGCSSIRVASGVGDVVNGTDTHLLSLCLRMCVDPWWACPVNLWPPAAAWPSSRERIREQILKCLRLGYDCLTSFSSPIWYVTDKTLPIIADGFTTANITKTVVLRFLLVMVGDMSGTMLTHLFPRHMEESVVACADALLEDVSKYVRKTPAFNPFAVIVNKMEAIVRLSDMFRGTRMDIILFLNRLEMTRQVYFPIRLSRLVDLCLETYVPESRTPKLSDTTKKYKSLVKAKRAVVRTLQCAFKDDRGLGARLEGDVPPAYLSRGLRVAMAELKRVLCSHGPVQPGSIEPRYIADLCDHYCDALFEYQTSALPYRLRGEDISYAEALVEMKDLASEEEGENWAYSFLVDHVHELVNIWEGHAYVSLYNFVRVLQYVPPEYLRGVVVDAPYACYEKSSAADIPQFDSIRKICLRGGEEAVPYLADSVCMHSSKPLMAVKCDGVHTTAEMLSLAYAMPSPFLVISRVMKTRNDDLDAYVAAYAVMWQAARVARRTMDAISRVTDPTMPSDAAAASPTKRRKVTDSDITCMACGDSYPRVISMCEAHPMCRLCMVNNADTYLIDVLKFVRTFDMSAMMKCPVAGCEHRMNPDYVTSWLSREMCFVIDAFCTPTPPLPCALCGCGVDGDVDDTVATCTVCETQTCLQCKCVAHVGDVCSSVYVRETGLAPENILSEAKRQLCPGCSMPSVKSTGCNHMACVCGTHWCWTCGEKVNSLDPSSHYSDAVGGTEAALCKQFAYNLGTEVDRIVRVINSRTDLTPELKKHCVDMVRGGKGADVSHSARDL